MHQIKIINNLKELMLALNDESSYMITAPANAIYYMGLPYIEQMLEQASKDFPQIYDRFILDVQDDGAICHQALGGLVRHILFTGSQKMYHKLKTLADRFGVGIYLDHYIENGG